MKCKHCNNGSECSTDCKHTPEETQEMFRESVLAEMRKSDAYKVGFLRSAIRTAISMLEHDHAGEALRMLKASYETEARDK